jgi:hypothetical protein
LDVSPPKVVTIVCWMSIPYRATGHSKHYNSEKRTRDQHSVKQEEYSRT